MTHNYIQQGIAKLEPWFHKIQLPGGHTTKSKSYAGEPDDHPLGTWHYVQKVLPENLSGKTVLDIGCNGGFYSIQANLRGAKVLGVDAKRWHVRQALFASQALNLRDINFKRESLYSLKPNVHGTFDVVLALGLVYHLKHLVKGLEGLFDMCQDLLILETAVLDSQEHISYIDSIGHELFPLRYVKNDAYKDEAASNWFFPTAETVKAMLEDVGFSEVQIHDHFNGRCVLTARKNALSSDSRFSAFLGVKFITDTYQYKGSPGEEMMINVLAENIGRGRWLCPMTSEDGIGLVTLSLRLTSEEEPLFDEELPRYSIERSIDPGDSHSWNIIVPLPTIPGNYILEVDLVSEHVNFFGDTGSEPLFLNIHVIV